MPQCTGICRVYFNGELRRSYEGAKLDVGGKERTAQVGHSVYGYSEKVVPSKITFDEAHMADTDLVELGALVDATVRFETDVGVVYLVNNAFASKPPELTGGDGKAGIEIIGDPAKKE
jgi:hypothetical protein